MGVQKEQAVTRREGPRKDKSEINWNGVAPAGDTARVTWDEATPSKALKLVHLATRRGMAVSFSATSNGRAVSLTILDGGERPKWYANTPDELDALLDSLIARLG